MAVTFLDPGGDATFLATVGNVFEIGGIIGTPTIATDFVHGGHIKSYAHAAGASSGFRTPNGTLGDTGGRVSFYYYFNALPGSANAICQIQTAGGSAVNFYITVDNTGVIRIRAPFATQIGTDGPTLYTGQWYRISVAYTITSTTVNRIELFVNGGSAISITNATLVNTGSSCCAIGATNTTLTDSRSSDYYTDNSSALTDPGNIWVTAKRPNANGTSNQFITQVGAGGSGYGTGHSPQVNERPLSTTNGWSLSNTTKSTEEYSIEGKSTGDIDISTATIVDYMGWISAKVDSTANTPVHNIIVGGVATSKVMTTSAAIYTQIAGSSTYPAGNTDIGMDAQFTTTPHVTSLFECGIVVAYIPAVPTHPTRLLPMQGAGL